MEGLSIFYSLLIHLILYALADDFPGLFIKKYPEVPVQEWAPGIGERTDMRDYCDFNDRFAAKYYQLLCETEMPRIPSWGIERVQPAPGTINFAGIGLI